MKNNTISTIGRLGSVALLAALLSACSSLYYATMEKFGYEKRHIMVDRVEEARDQQEAAKVQFQSTLDRFKQLTGAQGGDLESYYGDLAADYAKCEKKAAGVTERIDAIQDVATDMFEEWGAEIDEISNAEYQRDSRRLLGETRQNYQKMYEAMRRAEQKMAPVLQAFKDQVLFLKHNLNAKMIASLQNTVVEIETDVGALIAEMESSIQEANEFIDGMALD